MTCFPTFRYLKIIYYLCSEQLKKHFYMSKTINNANGVKNSSSLAVKAVNDYFKAAKGLNTFNGEVLSIKVDETKDGAEIEITIETKDFWAKVYKHTHYREVNILLKTNFLTDDMVGDITFIDQNKGNIISSYNKSKKAA